MQHQVKLFIPEGLSNFSPYVYWIEHIPSKRLYHGAKYEAATCDSSTLMTEDGYRTSSKYINELIKSDGLDSFRVLCIRHFATAQEVIAYEEAFLCKVNAKNHHRYINESNGGLSFIGPHKEETKKKMSDAHKGKPLSDSHKLNISNVQQNRSPEEKEILRQEQITAYHNRSKEKETLRRQRISDTHQNRSQEEKEIIKRRQSAAAIKREQTISSDQKEITRQRKSAARIKIFQNMSPDQKEARSQKLSASHIGLMRYNNGQRNIWAKEIPEGVEWKSGWIKLNNS